MTTFEEIRHKAQQAAVDRYREIDSADIPLTVLSEVVDAVLRSALSTDAEPVAWIEADQLQYLRDANVSKLTPSLLLSIGLGGSKEGRFPLYAEPVKTAPAAVAGLMDACQLMADDYQTSESHHPNHVLVPLTAFEAVRSALSAQVQVAPAVTLTRLSIRTGGSGANVYAFTEADDNGDYVFYTEAKSALAAQVQDVARPMEDWHEDHGFVTWWKFPVNEPSYIGSPLCDDWPGYHTHWTPHPAIPASPASKHGDAE